ncbi:phosphatidate cytidylyltransferase [Vagococcus carniphilus]|uniref:phosphatidate cytidylyltransferase n=1 Tax=Vagococcus carniphilus TaxID=218144 RepID=UPI0028927469|nr:phosphatidate cytidylyltransferase [Vagococcus carniphilus]MDT2829478.1 phosphatidate cytidylyltransferase [Vagococcus carniphilus]MDT2838937.1 phosphatidate cytidylyltransferase [Vagococcus carniphilus]MDT2852995.1 phosphatidate cytidylyltransferase [Vagococcus carniphilus]
MKQRVITAVVALIFFIPLIILGGMPLQILAACMAAVGVYELFNMSGLEIKSLEGVLAVLGAVLLVLPKTTWFSFLPEKIDNMAMYYLIVMLILMVPVFSKNSYTFEDAAFPVLVSLYVGIGFQNFIAARETGIPVLMFALLVVWSTDIGAYFCGMKFGKNKLAPHISPNKTIEGAVGGILCAVVVAGIYMVFWPLPYNMIVMLVLTAIFSVVGQMGDLVQSAYKRHYGVKDSGKILPGHGGILDRFDSLLFVFPLMHLVGLF